MYIFLSVFSEVYISVVHFLDNSYLHIRDSVAWLVEMISCCFVEVFVGYIAFMFRESGLNRAVRFSNILLCTFRARNTIDCILCLAINWPDDCHYCITSSSLDLLPLDNKRADGTSIAFLHAWQFYLGSEGGGGGTLDLTTLSLILGGLL